MQCHQRAKLCSLQMVERVKREAHTGVCDDEISESDLSVKALKHMEVLKSLSCSLV